jgi:hypothetical protein
LMSQVPIEAALPSHAGVEIVQCLHVAPPEVAKLPRDSYDLYNASIRSP